MVGTKVMTVFGVWQRNFEPAVCVHGTTGWELTKHIKNICEPQRVILVKHSSVLPYDGLHTNQNMLEWFLIVF